MSISRRSFLQRCALVTTCAALGSYEYTQAAKETYDLEVVEYSAKIRDLPNDLRGYRIGFLSDLHLGVWVPHEWIESAMARIREAKPDLFVLGGDYVWVPEDNLIRATGFVRNKKFANLEYHQAAHAIYKDLADLVQTVKAPDGRIGVVGNHDRWVDPNACFEHFNPSVMSLLVNQTTTIKRGSASLRIWGGDDYLTGIPSLPAYSREPETVDLFLSHNPDLVAYSLRESKYQFDLALCGHTHGGQVKIFGASALTYAVEDQRFTSGACVVGEQTVYTNRGIGIVEVPYRLHCRPEATVITLS